MFVVIADLVAKLEHVDSFRTEMAMNARASLANEPGYRQLDVSVVADDPSKIFLYELCDDRVVLKVQQLRERQID